MMADTECSLGQINLCILMSAKRQNEFYSILRWVSMTSKRGQTTFYSVNGKRGLSPIICYSFCRVGAPLLTDVDKSF
jgi:hypothetical protein